MALGEVLQERRNKLSLSQNELAKASDFHRSYISDVERGYRNISLKNLSRLAIALQTSVSHLLAVAEEKMAQIQQLNVYKDLFNQLELSIINLVNLAASSYAKSPWIG